MVSALSIIGCALACPFLCFSCHIAAELCKQYWNSLSLGYRPVEATELLLQRRCFIDDAENV